MMLPSCFSGRDRLLLSVTLGVAMAFVGSGCRGEEYLTGIQWSEPPMVTPGDHNSAPSDAVVLFDGKDLSAWDNGENWAVKDGIATIGKGDISTKERFGDCQLHIEWLVPKPKKGEDGQLRGNSGIFFGPYEMQVLDSYRSKTYFDGQAGAIYKQTPPMVNAMRPPGEWNVYDILWTAPRFNDDGTLRSPAYITALHNGVLILNHFEILGDTPYHRPPQYKKHDLRMPILLQEHGNPVCFRNIWARHVKPLDGPRTRKPYIRDGDKEWPVEEPTPGTIK